MHRRSKALRHPATRAGRGWFAVMLIALSGCGSSCTHYCACLAVLLMLLAPAAAVAEPGQPNLKALFEVVGRTHNIDADLLAAMAEVESGGDPLSVSPKGAMGLMQLMPGTAAEFSVLDPFDPVSNVIGAANFIDYLRNRFADNFKLQGLPTLLAAYNAGPGAVEKYGGIPPYAETHKYVQRVIARYAGDRSARSQTPPVLILTPAPYLIQVDPRSDEPRAEPVLIDAGIAASLNQPGAMRPVSEPVLAAAGTGTAPWIRIPVGVPHHRIDRSAIGPAKIFRAERPHHHNRGIKR
jgi:hypothetical protein